MKNLTLIVILCIVALGGGFGLILAAGQYGWIGSDTRSPGVCPHEIDEARCPFCTPSLVETMGWCGGHDVPEANCTRCNAYLIPAYKATGDWCAEHGLPESQCAICGGVATTDERIDLGIPTLASLTYAPGDADVMRINRAPSRTCTNVGTTVQLASPEIARRVGLQFEPVEKRTVDMTASCNAVVAFDGDFTAELASRAAGSVAEVRVDLGDSVEAGEVLALIDSSELGLAKAAFLQASSLVNLREKNHARQRSLFEQQISTEKSVLESETELVESQVTLSNARQRLRNLGLSEQDIADVQANDDTSSMLSLRAPFAGEVVDRHAVPGEVIDTDDPLFTVVDLRTMWVMLDVDERDVPRLTEGLGVSVTVDAMRDLALEGELTWISAEVDPRTRTIKARAEVENADGLLKANMFGRAVIHVRRIEDALLVPQSAVQWDGCCNVVFVRHTDTVFQPYQVTLGGKYGSYFIVENGLPDGESVVTQGSYLLKTEILKGNIGAGCCETDPGANK